MLEGLATFHLGPLGIDLLVVLAVATLVLLYSYSIGRDHGVTMLQSLYIAGFIFLFVPQVFEMLPTLGLASHYASLAYLGILFLIVFFILIRNGFFESPTVPSMWEIGVFGLLWTGLAAAITTSYLPEDVINWLSASTRAIFTGDVMFSVWAGAPLLFWLIIRGDE